MVKRALRDLFRMDTNLIHKGLVPSWPNNLAEAPLPNTATLSIWIPTFEWGGGRGDPKYSDYSNILANIQHYQLHPLCSISTPSPIQFSSVTESRPTLCDPMNRSTPGLPVHHQLPEFLGFGIKKRAVWVLEEICKESYCFHSFLSGTNNHNRISRSAMIVCVWNVSKERKDESHTEACYLGSRLRQ